ncbi:hypothetical protein ACLWBD_12815 [Bdellovibrio sp. HCB117]|uniref:hypothetical protein n=1 Tax=Bdellovibrio sp. HCB117 TaxID=3394359 RepID=UPI0039B609A9
MGYVGTVGKVPVIETNLYGYAFSDPVNFIDPEGLTARSPESRMMPDADNRVGRPPICDTLASCKKFSDALTIPGFIPGSVAGGLGYFIKGFKWGFNRATQPNAEEQMQCEIGD